jgi:hypothetical protein
MFLMCLTPHILDSNQVASASPMPATEQARWPLRAHLGLVLPGPT